jgi:hypothetical protein
MSMTLEVAFGVVPIYASKLLKNKLLGTYR